MDSLRSQIARYGKAAWRRRWVALIAAWIVCAIGWSVVYLLPNQYEVTARLYVDSDAVLTPLLRGVAADNSSTNQVELLQRTLLSRPNIERLLSKSGMDLNLRSQAERERFITDLATDVKIKPQTKTLFTIEYRNSDKQLAYNVVNGLLGIFVESAMGSNRADMENAKRFLDRQIASYEQQLGAAERRRADFRLQYLSILPQDNSGAGAGQSRLDQVRALVATLTGQLQDAVVRRDGLKQELTSTPQAVSPEVAEAAAGGGGRLSQAEEQLRDLRLRYTEENPDVIAAKNLVASLRASPASGGARGTPRSRSAANPAYDQVRLRLVDAEAAVSSLKRQLDEASRERNSLEDLARQAPGVEAEFKALDRDYAVLKRDYEELLIRREAAQIAQAAETQAQKVKLNVVDPPQVPRAAVSPNRAVLLPAVLVAGILAGSAIAFLLGQFDRSFRTIEDLRSLGLPVLGGISLLGSKISPRRVASTVGFFAGVAALILVFGGLLAYVLRTLPVV